MATKYPTVPFTTGDLVEQLDAMEQGNMKDVQVHLSLQKDKNGKRTIWVTASGYPSQAGIGRGAYTSVDVQAGTQRYPNLLQAIYHCLLKLDSVEAFPVDDGGHYTELLPGWRNKAK